MQCHRDGQRDAAFVIYDFVYEDFTTAETCGLSVSAHCVDGIVGHVTALLERERLL